MKFWRIYDNILYEVESGDTNQLGFADNDPLYIPDEYLQSKLFGELKFSAVA